MDLSQPMQSIGVNSYKFIKQAYKNSNHNFLEDKNVPEQKECPIYVILDKNNNIFGIINSAFYDIKNNSLEKILPKELAVGKAISPHVKRMADEFRIINKNRRISPEMCYYAINI